MLEFLPAPALLAAYAAAAVVLTLTPGPDMTLFLAKTVGQSRSAGFASAGGAFTGLFVHTVLVALGLSAVLAASATAFTILKIVGALYLAWLAVDALRHGSGFTVDGARSTPEPLRRIFAKGLMINLLNPKIIVFFITFLPQFVRPDDPFATGKLLFLGVAFILIALPVTATIILTADRLAVRLRTSPRLTRWIDWLFAAVMGGFAVKLLLSRAN